MKLKQQFLKSTKMVSQDNCFPFDVYKFGSQITSLTLT